MSQPRILINNEEARIKILSGVSQLNTQVAATMGAKGRNIIIENEYGRPTVTKDGVTVARSIFLPDPFENMGAQLVKEAATKTNDAAGDGTTTATVLAHAMMLNGMEHLKSGRNPIVIKSGIDRAVKAVTEFLKTFKRDVASKEQYAAIATISAQDSEIGEIIAEVIDHVGKDGVVTVEPGQTLAMEKEYVEGMQFDSGWISPYFVTNPNKMEAAYSDVAILLADQRISSVNDLVPILEAMAEQGKKEIVIIAEAVEGDALALLVTNRIRGTLLPIAIRAPAFGERRKEILKDIAAVTGATVISKDVDLTVDKATLEHLGAARKVIVKKNSTVIVDGDGDEKVVKERIEGLRGQIEEAKGDDKMKLQERLAKLTGGVAVIKVGAATEVEQREKQHRVEDALSATRAAAEEGIVAGGGVAYIRAAQHIADMDSSSKDEQIGIDIVIDALHAPARTLLQNAGVDVGSVMEQIIGGKGNTGYNCLTDVLQDLVENMVIDPKKVSRCALENAASVASMFLTLEGANAAIPTKDKPLPESDDL